MAEGDGRDARMASGDGGEPEGAAVELAFAGAVDVAGVGEEVEDGLGRGVFEELGDGGGELEAALADGAVGEGGGVEMGAQREDSGAPRNPAAC